MVEVEGPQRIRIDRQHIADQLGKDGLVIQHPARQQPLAVGIDHHAVVVTVLINNRGVGLECRDLTYSDEEIRRNVETNFLGPRL